jgi:hypothetical protein
MSDRAEAQRLVDASGINMLQHIRRTPLILCGMFVELTRSIYSFEENLYPPARTWSATNEKDHLFIDPAYKWDEEDVDRFPAIYVDVGDVQLSADPVKGIGSHGTGFDLEEGVDYREHVAGTSIAWAHVCKSRAECLLYQGVTYDLIAGLSFVIKRDFCLEKFDVRAILKPRLQNDQLRTYVSEVQATLQFRERYALKRETPKLKQITVEAAGSTVAQMTFNLVK